MNSWGLGKFLKNALGLGTEKVHIPSKFIGKSYFHQIPQRPRKIGSQMPGGWGNLCGNTQRSSGGRSEPEVRVRIESNTILDTIRTGGNILILPLLLNV